MTKENKELLLRDLCARLPYGVKCKIGNYNYVICDISFEKQYDVFYNSGRDFPIGVIGTEDNGNTFYTSVYEKHIKPYLFPLSSMTEEIMDEIYNNTGIYDIDVDSPVHLEVGTTFEDLTKVIHILHKHHIDYRGLIPMDLAIDATGKNIY